jgi:hypothetical protein
MGAAVHFHAMSHASSLSGCWSAVDQAARQGDSYGAACAAD